MNHIKKKIQKLKQVKLKALRKEFRRQRALNGIPQEKKQKFIPNKKAIIIYGHKRLE